MVMESLISASHRGGSGAPSAACAAEQASGKRVFERVRMYEQTPEQSDTFLTQKRAHEASQAMRGCREVECEKQPERA